MTQFNIGILDDEDDILYSLSSALQKGGHRTFIYKKGANLINNLLSQKLNIIFLDINLGEIKSGLEYLSEIKQLNPTIPVIVISGNADIKTAVRAIKNGASDFIEKPINIDELYTVLENITENLTIRKERNRLLDDILEQYEIIGDSSEIVKVKSEILKYSKLKESVLITGENGTGKELVAANLHYLSNRKSEKYNKINIASIPETLIESELFGYKKGAFSGAITDKTGIFKSSDNSTLFIDEIGEMKYELQAKLLRIIQEKEFSPLGSDQIEKVDARLIFATNKLLIDEVKNKTFREDLYYRISTLTINIPPLRNRIEDIIPISNKLIKEFSEDNNFPIKQLNENAINKLSNYNFPGNVRELKNILTRAIINSCNNDKITENDIILNNDSPQKHSPIFSDNFIFESTELLSIKKKQLEDLYIEAQLKKFDYDLHETASQLGILVNNLYRKMKK